MEELLTVYSNLTHPQIKQVKNMMTLYKLIKRRDE